MISEMLLGFSFVVLAIWLSLLIKFIILNKSYFKSLFKRDFVFVLIFIAIGFFFLNVIVIIYSSEIWTHIFQASCVSNLGQGSFCNFNLYGSDHELIMPLILGFLFKIFGQNLLVVKLLFSFVMILSLIISFFIFRSRNVSRFISFFASLCSIVLFYECHFSSFVFGFVFLLFFIFLFVNRKILKTNFWFILFTILFLIFVRVEFVFFMFPFVIILFLENKKSLRLLHFFVTFLFVFVFLLLVKYRTLDLSSNINFLLFFPFVFVLFFILKSKLKLKESLLISLSGFVLLLLLFLSHFNYFKEYSFWNVFLYKLPLWLFDLFKFPLFNFFGINLSFLFFCVVLFSFILCVKKNNLDGKVLFLAILSLFYSYSVLEHNFVDFRFLSGIVFLLIIYFVLFFNFGKFVRLFVILLLVFLLLVNYNSVFFPGDVSCTPNDLLNDFDSFNSNETYIFGVNSFEFYTVQNRQTYPFSYNFIMNKPYDIVLYDGSFVGIPNGLCDVLSSLAYSEIINRLNFENLSLKFVSNSTYFEWYKLN
ncbi:hypothetical protein JXM83_00900 [Candidatus Woesearchaeota archaeon]|nr:hypothetical protein [Candidatus Woesearchaeota archaeon]